ncbi:MAG: hypothetical protein ACTSV2_11365, partial [Candidatus Thorarchaeota archaeon]
KELQRILINNIHSPAGEGDIVRMTMMWLGSQSPRAGERAMNYVDSVKRGADVRMMLSLDLFKDNTTDSGLPPEVALQMLQGFTELKAHGLKSDLRVQVGSPTYNAIILNNDCIAMIISDNPLTGTFVTGEFNQDLIDDAVNAFDAHWENALSMVSPDVEALAKSEIMKSKFIVSVLKKIYPNFPG